MSFRASQPVGAILAGGRGRRLGGSKATVSLNGRPLISYALEAMQQALETVVIVAKAGSDLPKLPAVEVWMEPERPAHPLAGVVHALGISEGRPVMVCPCDLPLVSGALIAELAGADPGRAPAVIARADGQLQPLLGCYQPEAFDPLSDALNGEGVPVRAAVGLLEPRIHDVSDPTLLFNVNTPEDLLRAGALLAARGPGAAAPAGEDQPNVKS